MYYIHVAKTKELISFAVTAKLICGFVFTYADCWFFDVVAHFHVLFYHIFKKLQIYKKLSLADPEYFLSNEFLRDSWPRIDLRMHDNIIFLAYGIM